MYSKPVVERFGEFRELTQMIGALQQIPGGCQNPVPGVMNPNCNGTIGARIS